MEIISINYIFYLILVVLPIYRDSPLSKYLGAGGYSILTALCPLLFIMRSVATSGKIKLNIIEKKIFCMMLWVLVSGLIGSVIWLLQGNSITILGEILPIKDIKVFILVIAFPIYLYLFRQYSANISEDRLFKPIEYSLWFLALFCILESTQLPYAFERLHYAGTFPYYRIRLLTTESSWTAPIIYDYAILALFYSFRKGKKIHTIFNLASTFILCFFTTSKTLLIYLLLTVIIIYFFSIKKLSRRTIIRSFFILGIAIIVFLLALPNLIVSLQGDIKNFTSVATRTYTMINAIFIGCIVPFGVGGSFIGYFVNALRDNMNIFQSIDIPLNTSEIISIYSRSTDAGVTTSAGFFVFHMYWGVIGSVIWFRFYTVILNKINSLKIKGISLIFSGLLANLLLSLICVDYNFEFWMFLSFALLLCRRFEDNTYENFH